MTTTELLQSLRQEGLRVVIEDDGTIKVRGQNLGDLRGPLLALLPFHKQALLGMLAKGRVVQAQSPARRSWKELQPTHILDETLLWLPRAPYPREIRALAQKHGCVAIGQWRQGDNWITFCEVDRRSERVGEHQASPGGADQDGPGLEVHGALPMP